MQTKDTYQAGLLDQLADKRVKKTRKPCWMPFWKANPPNSGR